MNAPEPNKNANYAKTRIKSASTIPLLFLAGAIALFALAFLNAASLGMPLAYDAADLYIHDTYYVVVTHFHPVLMPGTAFALFAAVYHWFPKLTGRILSRTLGLAHFCLSLIFTLGAFLPMCLMGTPGTHRRWYQGGPPGNREIIALTAYWNHWNILMSVSLFLLAATQFIFVFNLIRSVFKQPAVR